MHAALPAGADVERSASTGKVRFAGGSLGRPAGFTAASDPAAVGRAFLERSASDFGLSRASSLRATRTRRRGTRGSTVRYQQTLNGVPVLGGEFVVRLDANNGVQSTNGEATPAASIDPTADISSVDATTRAIAYVAKHQDVPAPSLRAAEPSLVVFDPAVVGGPGVGPRLVWSVEVSDGLAIRERVFVDADLGVIVASLDGTHEAKNRTVCDRVNFPGPPSTATCTSPVRSEGQGPVAGNPDVNDAYDFAGATYDYYLAQFGRDSIDGAGLPLKSTVRFCNDTDPCPYANAFWNGVQMVYGDNYASDDIVAHELTHGVTQHESALLYYFQSGAINESLSDIFGEILDQATPSANDAANQRWLIGEDLPGGSHLRNMANPPARGHPDRMQSSVYYVGEADSGGVHFNSGVGNKAAVLMVDGGSFNGRTVTALGATKTAAIFYEVQTAFLTSGSDYADLGTALPQACGDLVGTKGITFANCTEVRDAVAATEMFSNPPAPATQSMAECAPSNASDYTFFDNVDGPQRFTPTTPGAGQIEWSSDYTPSTIDDYSHSGTTNWWGYNRPLADDYSIVQNFADRVTIPAAGFLSFEHAHSFEGHIAPLNYDGGVVEYSTNNGTSWNDLVAASGASGIYNGTVNSASNVLNGRQAFTGVSHGYRKTVIPLGALAGQTVQFRFRIGTDSSIEDYGWWIDDIAVGTCSAYSFESASAADEGSGTDQIVVRRGGGLGGVKSVRVTTTSAGSATPGSDFNAVNTTVDLAPNESATIPLTVINDTADEPNETVGVSLSLASSPDDVITTSTVALADNDEPAPPPPPPPPPPGDTGGTGPGGTGGTGGTTGTGTSVGGSATSTSGGPGTVGGGGNAIGAAPVTVLSVRPGARRVTFRMRLSRPGTVTVTGRLKGKRIRGIKRNAAAGPVTVNATLPRTVRNQLKRKAARVTFTIVFEPADGGEPVASRRAVRLPRRR